MTIFGAYSRILQRWRWSALLVALLVAFLIQSVTTQSQLSEAVSSLLYATICVGALFLTHPPRWVSRVGLTVLVLWVLLKFFDFGLGRPTAELLRVLASSTLVAGAFVLTFQQLFSHEMSNMDRLSSAVFGYFVMAMAWAMLFMQIELFRPGSFNGLGSESPSSEFIYFSLITITSLGYGDILPASGLARILSGFEVAGGTLYIAIFIGRVVGSFR